MSTDNNEHAAAPKGADDKTSQPNGTSEKTDQPNHEADVKTVLAQKAHWQSKAQNAMQEAETLKAQIKEQEEAQLAEQNKFKELYENTKSELEKTKKQSEEVLVRSAFMTEAMKHNPVDPNDLFKLADLKDIKIDGDSVNGIEDVVNSLVESKPHLFQQGNKSVNSSATAQNQDAAGTESKGKTWKASEVRALQSDPKKLASLMPEIQAAIDSGNYIND